MIFSPTRDNLIPYFMGKQKHITYDQSTDLYQQMNIHAEGKWPEKLLGKKRPNEPMEIMTYRKENFQPLSMAYVDKVFTSLGKIFRTVDFMPKYPPEEKYAPTGEDLETYCEYKYPQMTSLTNWTSAVLLKNQLTDANAVVMVMPLNVADEIAENEYYKPYPFVFNSPQVYEYKEGELAILLADEKVKLGNQIKNTGQVWYVVTDTIIQRWEQVTTDLQYNMVWEFEHNCQSMPAFRVRGVVFKQIDGAVLWNSRLFPMVPELNEALLKEDDLRAIFAQHVHPQKWEWANQTCDDCRGSGVVAAANSVLGFGGTGSDGKRNETCKKCGGNGAVGMPSPFDKKVIRAPNAGLQEVPAPIPPMGYITLPTDVIKLLMEKAELHYFKALAAINFQFLDQTPLNISGDAKGIDKDELNNFVHSIAADIIWCMDKIYYYTAMYRYGYVLGYNEESIEVIVPEVPVPDKFDLLNSDYLAEELKGVRDANLSPLLIRQAEIDFMQKKYTCDPAARETIRSMYELDPLPVMLDTDKDATFMAGGCTQLDYVMSKQLMTFVIQAIGENEDFNELELEEKRTIIERLAQKKLDGITSAEEVKQAAAIKVAKATKPIAVPV